MKTILSLIFAFVLITSMAQERKWDPPKPPATAKNGTITVIPINDAVTGAQQLAETLTGPGISISNIEFTGSIEGYQSGFFSNGMEAGLGIEEGIILSSGSVYNAQGPNTSNQISASLDLPGDADLSELAGFQTYDANILEFTFIPESDSVSIRFVFGSDEYLQYVNTQYNDVFAFFLNGENIALVPATSQPVTINTINHLINTQFFRNNSSSPYPFNIEADGFTTVLTALGAVAPGQENTIKLAIADGGDQHIDSWVFLEAGSFTISNPNQDDPDDETGDGDDGSDDETDNDDDDPTPLPIGNSGILLAFAMMVLFTFLFMKKRI